MEFKFLRLQIPLAPCCSREAVKDGDAYGLGVEKIPISCEEKVLQTVVFFEKQGCLVASLKTKLPAIFHTMDTPFLFPCLPYIWSEFQLGRWATSLYMWRPAVGRSSSFLSSPGMGKSNHLLGCTG